MTHPRYPEIDLLRTLAIAMMVVYHTLFDLEYYYGWPVLRSLGEGGWIWARSIAVLFLLLTGVSFAISWNRSRRDDMNLVGQECLPTEALAKVGSCPTKSEALMKILGRSGRILACAALISLATYVWDPETYIRFGILHLIGVSALLLPVFASFRIWNILLGIGIFLSTPFLSNVCHTHILVYGYIPRIIGLPLGCPPPGFTTLDYFPLLPWFGVILLGAGLGFLLYTINTQRRHHFPFPILRQSFVGVYPEQRRRAQDDIARDRFFHFPFLEWPSRHSLLLYMIHQPLVLLLLTLLLGKPS